MKLWLLKREDDDRGWDEYLGFVILASSEMHARQIASKVSGDEGPIKWWQVPCIELSTEGAEEGVGKIILASFNAG